MLPAVVIPLSETPCEDPSHLVGLLPSNAASWPPYLAGTAAAGRCQQRQTCQVGKHAALVEAGLGDGHRCCTCARSSPSCLFVSSSKLSRCLSVRVACSTSPSSNLEYSFRSLHSSESSLHRRSDDIATTNQEMNQNEARI
jgi:hypothetical protein